MPIQFIKDKPALLIADRKYGRMLVIADIHLGIEQELYNKGISISPQSDKMRDEVLSLLKMTKASKLVIVGDLKHKIPGITFREIKEIPKFLEPVSEKAETILAKGNHDTMIDGLTTDIQVHGSRGFSIGPYGFFHGHAWPAKELMACEYLFTAHIHPSVEFVDSLGFRTLEKVWVKGAMSMKKIKEKYNEESSGKIQTVIMPPFNPIITGSPLNSNKNNSMGPLLSSRTFDIKKADAYLLDGTHIGKIGRIRKAI